ncbi:phage tail tape measure protein [Starkeya sp. ORNL1]|uniref:phage tail tape measure protein n=1 Tax=Starkeya sp. ORNL1 TaxID=2709380 RepID=UPI001463EFCB|nr:phage tail tape measure protein [Starkeya sp. ORNL1]QJP12988.1 phage tail tape measure protein [Starkeya sp. ORNL1]
MATLTSSLLVKLIDGVSGPAKVAASSLQGLRRVAGGVSGGIGGVLAASETSASRFGRTLLGVAGTAAIVGFALKRAFDGPVDASLAYGTILEDIGQKADLSGGQLQDLGETIRKIARDSNQAAQQTAGTFDTLLGLGLGGKTNAEDVSNALGMLPAINKTATAYRAASDDIARAGQAVFANLKVPSNEVIRAFDAMAASGKEGAFELRDMARYFPSITALGQNLGIKGVKGAADLAAALQVVRQGAGNAEEAATNLINVLQKAGTPTTQKAFKKMGINFREEMKKLTKKGMSPIEAMVETTRKAMAKGATIGDLFEDRQAQLGMLALLQDTERYRKIREQALSASGMVEADFARRIQTSQAAFDRFRASAENLQIAIGNKVMPVVTTFLDSFTQGLNTLDQRVSIFDRIGKAIGGFASGLGFDGVKDLKGGLEGLMNLVLGNIGTLDRDTDQLAVIFGRFREMGSAARALADGVGAVMGPLPGFIGSDWGTIIGWGATIGGAALGFAAFGKALSLIGRALWILSGASAGVAVLRALLGAVGIGTAAGAGVAGAAAAGGGLLAGATRLVKIGTWLAAIVAAYQGIEALLDRLNSSTATESGAPDPLGEKYRQDHPAYTPPEGGSQGFYDRRMQERQRFRQQNGLPPISGAPAGAGGIGSDFATGVQQQVDTAKAAVESLDTATGTPNIDTRSIDQAIEKVQRLLDAIQNVNSSTVSPRIGSPRLGQGLRGIHADIELE